MQKDVLFRRALMWARIRKYRLLGTCPHVEGAPNLYQPALFLGPGRIVFGAGVDLGWPTSVNFWEGYCHFEVATPEARIELGDGVQLNNNAFLKSEGPGIHIEAHGLLGSYVQIFDTDFHELDPRRRRGGTPRTAPVHLEPNVFVGEHSLILKGVTIGRDSVVGAGSVVTRSIPAGVVAAGNPARVVREL